MNLKFWKNKPQLEPLVEVKSSFGSLKVINGADLFGATNKEEKATPSELIENGYGKNATAYAVISTIARVGAELPLKVQTSKDEVTWEDENGEIQETLNNPSETKTENEFRQEFLTYLLSTGNVYLKKEAGANESVIVSFSDDKKKITFEILPTNLVKLDLNTDNEIKYFDYFKNGTGVSESLIPELIEHAKLLNPTSEGHTSKLGLSPLRVAYQIIKASNNLALADASMLENRGALGVISNKQGAQVMTETERKKIQSATDEIIGGAENFGKAIVSPVPVDYTSIGLTSSELQMIEGGVYKDRIICNVFNVPSALFNDSATATLDNLKLYTKQLYTNAVIPFNTIYIRTLSDVILPKGDGLKYRIIQDTTGIEALQEDLNIKAERDEKEIDSILKIAESNISEEMKEKLLLEKFGYEYTKQAPKQED